MFRAWFGRASRCTLQYEIPHFDGARFLTRAFYINRLSAHAVKRAPLKALNNVLRVIRSCIKMHATIWNNAPRSVQLVARKNTHKNHHTSFRTEVKSFSPVACNSLHEIKSFRAWFIRATCCTLHGITLGMCRSCIKMHATI